MTTKRQQKANRKKWVAALRSGQYKQAKAVLCDEQGYCCLGVAIEVLAPTEWVVDRNLKSINAPTEDEPDRVLYGSLNETMIELLGMKLAAGQFEEVQYQEGWERGACALVTLNDSFDWDFAKIADFIEKEPEGLFE